MTPAAAPPASSAPSAGASVSSELMRLLDERFGLRPGQVTPGSSFLELGADSLSLLQVSALIKERFGVKVPFRLLFGELPTIQALADHVDRARAAAGPVVPIPAPPSAPARTPLPAPAGAVPPASPATSAPLSVPPALAPAPRGAVTHAPAAGVDDARGAPAPTGSLQSVIQQQLALMARQLELLQGRGVRSVVSRALASETHAPVETSAAIGTNASARTGPSEGPAIADEGAVAPPAPAAAPNVPLPFVAYQKPSRAKAALGEGPARYTAALIERLSARTSRSKALTDARRPYLADPRASAGFRRTWKELVYPLRAARADGARVWDVDGREYVDLAMGFGALLFGHTPPFLIDGLRDQLDRGLRLGWESDHAGEAARVICQITGVERVAFCNSGTEAVMTALRLARVVTERSRIAMFEGIYHGSFDGVLVRGQHGPNGEIEAVPMAPGVSRSMVIDATMLSFDASSLDRLRAQAHQCAAILIEPLPSRRPDLDLRDLLHTLRTIADESGAALVFDEVVTGFRFHPAGGQALYGVRADIVTYGKAFGAGLPVAAIAGRARYLDALDGGAWRFGDDSYPAAETTYFGGTYFKHPLLMEAVWRTVSHLERHGAALCAELDRKTGDLIARLRDIFTRAGAPLDVVRNGSLFRFRYPRGQEQFEIFYYALLDHGVYIPETRSCFLSAAHGEAELDHIVRAVGTVVEEMRAAGFWQAPPWAMPAPASVAAEERRDTIAAPPALPLSEAQRELWLGAQILADRPSTADASESFAHSGAAYHLPVAVRLTGALDVAALRYAIQQVVDRHDALRLTIAADGSTQRVMPGVSVELPCVDLTDAMAAASDAIADADADAVQAWALAQAQRPFDLTTGPLVRAALARTGRDRWLLTIVVHHLATDGWSAGVMLREIGTIYGARAIGAAARLPPPASFQHYLAEPPGRETAQGDLEWWLAQYRDGAPALELPLDRPRSRRRSLRAATQRLHLDAAVAERLASFCQARRATPFAVLLTAFVALLSRLSDQHDVVVAVPSAGQAVANRPHLIGYCLNMLPLRCRCDAGVSLERLLIGVQATLLDAFEHQQTPYGQLIRALKLPREWGRLPLVSVFFNVETTAPSLGWPGLQAEVAAIETGATQYELVANLSTSTRGIDVEFTCFLELFDAATVAQWQRYFAVLVDALLTDPERAFDEVALLNPAEQAERRAWTESLRLPIAAKTMTAVLAGRVTMHPDALALEAGERAWSYATLDRAASRIARGLRARGVVPGDRVAVCGEPGADTLASLWGVWKCGAAYVPLDPAQPPQRLARMIEDARPAVVIRESSAGTRLDDDRAVGVADIIAAGAADDPGGGEFTIDDRHAQAGQTTAYVLYTSGTTGRPKGVAVSHAALVDYVTWAAGAYHDSRTRHASAWHTSLGFDLTVTSMFVPLAAGDAVIAYRGEPAVMLAAIIDELRAQVVKLTPAHLALLPEQAPAFHRVRRLVVGGEALSTGTAHAAWTWFGGAAEILNEYGPTEATVGCTMHRFDPLDTRPMVSIGHPASNVSIYVLDAAGHPAPPQVPGELCIGGPRVADGYPGEPRLTATRFVPDPWGDGTRLYRTGDRARWLRDGRLDYLGRADGQVKVRGHRIEMEEVRAALLRQPSIRDAIVDWRPLASGRAALIGYYAARQPIPAETLRAGLLEHLPADMVPARFVHLTRLPLSLHGKVERTALPAPDADAETAPVRVPPRTPAEHTLAGIWREVLSVAEVGASDNFFALGGDSILSIQIASRATRAGLRVTPRQVFEAPTLAALASLASGGTDVSPPAEHRPNQPDHAADAEPWSAVHPIQSWFFEQQAPAPHWWNQSVWLDVGETIEPAALTAAFAAVVAHHAALRMRFMRTAQGWRQRPSPRDTANLALVVDLSALTPGDQTRIVSDVASRAQATLSLEHGPIARMSICRLGGRGDRILLVAHHLIVDIVSWNILLGDLKRAYDRLRRGEPALFDAATTGYATWCERLAAHAGSDMVASELGWWEGMLDGISGDLPADNPSGANRYGDAAEIGLRLDADETGRLLDAPSRHPSLAGARPGEVLLAALGRALGRWTGRGAVLVDVEGHGREELWPDVDLTRTIGWCTAIYPLRIEVGGTAEDTLAGVADRLRELPSGGLGYGLLRYAAAPAVRARLARRPRGAVSFNYVGRRAGGMRAGMRRPDESSGPDRDPHAPRPHEIDVNAGIDADGLWLTCTYGAVRYQRATIERLVQDIGGELRAIAAPSAAAPDTASMPAAAREALLAELRAVHGEAVQVDDVYPLSPMQQGMLFHALRAPGSGVYLVRNAVTVNNLDAPAFRLACERLLRRHDVLRTSFHWTHGDEPLQVVHHDVPLPVFEEDWRGVSAAEQQTRLAALAAYDVQDGFDLAHPPLMRWRLVRLDGTRTQVLWTYHHLLLDGWSTALLLDELTRTYDALRRGLPVTEPRPRRRYADYIAWVRAQRLAEAEAFWRRTLHGVTPARLPLAEPGEEPARSSSADDRPEHYVRDRQTLPATLADALRALASRHELTVNTLLQGAWALVLAARAEADDIVFGSTVSGRPADLAGVEEMIGVFINTLPVRVRIVPRMPLVAWLRGIQTQQAEARQYDYAPLVQVHGWSGLPRGVSLFDSILVVDNYPAPRREAFAASTPSGIADGFEKTHYPLTVTALMPADTELTLLIEYDERRVARADAGALLAGMPAALEVLARADHASVDDARAAVAPPAGTRAHANQLLRQH